MRSIPDITPPAAPLEPSGVIAAIRQSGLVPDVKIVADGLLVEQVGRSHPVYKISVGGTPFAYLKSFGPKRGETDGDAGRELAIAKLAKTRPALKNAIPEVMPAGQLANVVITRAVDGKPSWSVDTNGTETPENAWNDLVARAIPRLAQIHRDTRDLAANGTAPSALRGPLPWALRLFSGDAPPELWSDPQIGSVLHQAGQLAQIAGGIRTARSLWRELCVIHGDLKHDNVLATDAGPVFLDWEMARLGDPCWDLAGLASHLPLLDEAGDGWGEDVISGCGRLTRAYADASRLKPQAIAQRIVLYTGAWLLMAAIQHRSTGTDATVDEGVASVCRKTAKAFSDTETLTRRIAGAAR